MIICANPSAQFQRHQEEIEDAVLRVMRSSSYILGPEVEALEDEFSKYIGSDFAIGVANGTDALELALRALDIGPGDEVITVSHTAVATVAAIEATGATPVLVDIEPDYYTLDTSQLESVFSDSTRAVIAVHLYGQAADLEGIRNFCNFHRLALVEDVSQAHGAMWNGQRLGTFGDIACFSCYPTKNLGAIGDAGLITTNNSILAENVRALREYGWKKLRYVSEFPGRNSRLDEIQAAILRVKLKYLDQNNLQRANLANKYKSALSSIECIRTPLTRPGAKHVYHLFVIEATRRGALQDHLRAQGIQAGIHYPVPVHLQAGYRSRIRCFKDMSASKGLKDRILSLPLYPELSEGDQDRVIAAIHTFNNSGRQE